MQSTTVPVVPLTFTQQQISVTIFPLQLSYTWKCEVQAMLCESGEKVYASGIPK